MIVLSKGRTGQDSKKFWEPIFKFYFCLIIKYIAPFVFCYALIFYLEEDFTYRYKGSNLNEKSYPFSTTMIGWGIAIVNLFVIFVPALFCKTRENLGFDIFEPFDEDRVETPRTSRRVMPTSGISQIEMSKVGSSNISHITKSSSNVSQITQNPALGSERLSTEQRMNKKYL